MEEKERYVEKKTKRSQIVKKEKKLVSGNREVKKEKEEERKRRRDKRKKGNVREESLTKVTKNYRILKLFQGRIGGTKGGEEEEGTAIVRALPPLVTVVALFVDARPALVEAVVSALPVSLLQFHGDEPREYCESFARPYLKALRVREDTDLEARCDEYSTARGILLDSWVPGVPGGTGRTFDWRLAAMGLSCPVVLAGGLDAGNVAAAIRQLAPAAVDVSGGVESAPGCKDARKMYEFVAAVRRADRQASRGEHNDE